MSKKNLTSQAQPTQAASRPGTTPTRENTAVALVTKSASLSLQNISATYDNSNCTSTGKGTGSGSSTGAGTSIGSSPKPALNNISVDFPQGKLTVILGPNGSGKTTLLKTALGLLPKTSGQILINNIYIEDISLKDRAKHISYLSQTRNVPSITAEKMVLHGRFPYLSWPRHYSKKDWQIVENAMTKTGSLHLRHRLITELSGGERQNVYLAMALAQDTDIIFMDEPTTYLDPEHQLAVMNCARTLCQEGKTVIMVLHDLSLALRHSQNIVVMNNGTVEAQGTPEEIYNSGILEKVFHVKISRIKADGQHYVYWLEPQE